MVNIFSPPTLQLDVIIVDLDGGSLHVPEHVTLTLMPEPMLSHAVNALNIVRKK